MDGSTQGAGQLMLVLEPESDRFDLQDDRWRTQVATFFGELEHEVDGVSRKVTPVPGSKGGIEQVVLALGTAGAFTAAVELFRAWLGRDRTRKLAISWSEGGEKQRVVIQGDGIDQSALRTVAEAAAARIGGGAWRAPATEPS